MNGGAGRCDAAELARRVNTAARLLGSGMSSTEATGVLVAEFGCSRRQARRYLDRAAAHGPQPVPDPNTVFGVRLPAALATRVRAHARDSGDTISALVSQALTEFLAGRRRKF